MAKRPMKTIRRRTSAETISPEEYDDMHLKAWIGQLSPDEIAVLRRHGHDGIISLNEESVKVFHR